MDWLQFIKENPDKKWDWELLSCNPNITWEIVKANPDKPWDWGYLSRNKMSKHSFIIKKKRIKERIIFILIDSVGNINLPRDLIREITMFI